MTFSMWNLIAIRADKNIERIHFIVILYAIQEYVLIFEIRIFPCCFSG
jgi:hypothetical protein